MATKNIVPRNNNEGQIGTQSKNWLSAFFNTLNLYSHDNNTQIVIKTSSSQTSKVFVVVDENDNELAYIDKDGVLSVSEILTDEITGIIKIRTATSTQISDILLEDGELAFATDTKNLYIGDGVTEGGILILGGSESTGDTLYSPGVAGADGEGEGATGGAGNQSLPSYIVRITGGTAGDGGSGDGATGGSLGYTLGGFGILGGNGGNGGTAEDATGGNGGEAGIGVLIWAGAGADAGTGPGGNGGDAGGFQSRGMAGKTSTGTARGGHGGSAVIKNLTTPGSTLNLSSSVYIGGGNGGTGANARGGDGGNSKGIYIAGGNGANASGSTQGGDGGDGGYIIMKGGNASGSTDGGDAGFIDTSARFQKNGGNLIMRGSTSAAGSIDTSGGSSANADGGSINLAGSGENSNGGSIDLSGVGNNSPGGSIKTSGGGGSIDTTGTGSIQFGVSATRTTVAGTATSARSQSLPNASGTISVEEIQTSTPTAGDTISVNTNHSNKTLYITPTETLATLTVNLPSNSNSYVGQIVRIFSTEELTALTVGAPSGTIAGITTFELSANTCTQFQKVAANTWIRLI